MSSVTKQIVNEAMRITAKDVREPQCVIDGLVKPINYIMKRPSQYSKPLEGNLEHYHCSELDSQYSKDLNKYIDFLMNEIKKENIELYHKIYNRLKEK